jgi:hypothetical protein
MSFNEFPFLPFFLAVILTQAHISDEALDYGGGHDLGATRGDCPQLVKTSYRYAQFGRSRYLRMGFERRFSKQLVLGLPEQ